MRNYVLAGWLLLPIGAWAYHEGPGQDRAALDAADAILVAAHEAAQAGDWDRAIARYEEASAALPKRDATYDERIAQRLCVELNKARMQANELPTARNELATLVEQLDQDPHADQAILTDARQALAQAQFYTTWIMRLEGLDRVVWEPEIEAARQNLRLLAEEAGTPDEAKRHRGDLEATVRLARLELEDLQGLPLPCQCKGCCSCNKPGKPRISKSKKQGPPKSGASSGPAFGLGGS